MKWQWITHTHSPNLILFFNGWGMDQRIVSHLHTDAEHDVLMVYDYRDLTVTVDACPDLTMYREIDVLAWSMGVWAYARIQDQLHVPVRKAIALNGTPCPIDDVWGISAAVYNATVRHFDEIGRKKFFRRMCGSREGMRWFEPHQPQRSLEDQRQELLAIQHFATRQTASTAPFTCALIGRHDKIIPTQHQLNYWQGTVDYTIIDSPHCAFWRWNSWKEIFDNVTTD